MKRVLFIDVRNATRSQIAEAWFNHLAAGWGQARSCGTMPASAIDPRAVQVMREVGLDLSGSPQGVNQQLLNESHLVALMGEDISPHAFSPTRIWNFDDCVGKPLEKVRVLRDEIRNRVRELIVEIRLEDLDSVSTLPQWQTLMELVSA